MYEGLLVENYKPERRINTFLPLNTEEDNYVHSVTKLIPRSQTVANLSKEIVEISVICPFSNETT